MKYALIAGTIFIVIAALVLAVLFVPAAGEVAGNLWYIIKGLCKNLT